MSDSGWQAKWSSEETDISLRRPKIASMLDTGGFTKEKEQKKITDLDKKTKIKTRQPWNTMFCWKPLFKFADK